MSDESDVSVAGNGQDAEGLSQPMPRKRRARKAQTSRATAMPLSSAAKQAKNKPARAAVKATGKAKAKAARVTAQRKPRTPDPAKLDQFGLRKGSIKSRAAQMYAKGKGATLTEVREAVGSTQFNVIAELEGKGFKIARSLVPGIGARQATKYKVLTK